MQAKMLQSVAHMNLSIERRLNTYSCPMLELRHTLACGTRESLNGRGAVEALKRQGPSPDWGMVTVSEESGTHLYSQGTECFSGRLQAFTLVRKRVLPIYKDGPQTQQPQNNRRQKYKTTIPTPHLKRPPTSAPSPALATIAFKQPKLQYEPPPELQIRPRSRPNPQCNQASLAIY